jgi:hypothetical protein
VSSEDAQSIRYQAQQAVEWARTALAHAGPPRSDTHARQNALIYAQIAQALSARDLADAQRDLAASNERLALTWDALSEEMVRRRNVRPAS